MREADGWAIVHDRRHLGDIETIVGPLPSEELANLVLTKLTCECKPRVVPVFFPDGISMVVSIDMAEAAMALRSPSDWVH